MHIITTPAEATEWVALQRRNGARIGFVPTMGALHEGHLGLVRQALYENDIAVASIFVNPLQFNDPRDLESYPRQPEIDRSMLEQAGCHLLFSPEKEKILEDRPLGEVDLGGLDRHWEGPLRPGHFQGVVSIVERLFFFVRPDQAYFGEKDRQQLVILQHVAHTLRWPERIIPCPTARAEDGLALSSRNARLDAEQREQATVLFRALTLAQDLAFQTTAEEVERHVEALLGETAGVSLEYFGLAAPEDLRPLQGMIARDKVIAMIAARLGAVRLIDNMTLVR